MTRTLLYPSKLPVKLWEDAISNRNWIRNCLSNSRSGMKNKEWFGKEPEFSNSLKFGQKDHAYINRSDTAMKTKLLPWSLKGHFVGIQSTQTLYRVYIPSTKRVIIVRQREFKVSNYNLPSTKMLLHFSCLGRTEAEKQINEEDEHNLDPALAHCLVAQPRSKDHTDLTKIPNSFKEAGEISD